MHRTSKIVTSIAIVALLLPLASADWMFAQSFEPDTGYDGPQFMFADPTPVGATDRVFFGVFSFSLRAGVNPNVGALRTQFEVPADEFHEAVFGVWRDCNGDGYVGMAETAVREYPDNLLLDKTVCPPTAGTPNTWKAGAHNYRGVVSELIPISRGETPRDSRVYRDDQAAVWGDFHRPDEKPFQRSCALRPQPRGTYESTGNFLNWIDCRGAQIFGDNNDVASNYNSVLTLVGDPANLKLADGDNWAQPGHPLHMQTFGSEDSSNTLVNVQDCNADYIVRTGDVLNQTGVGSQTAGPAHNTEIRPLPTNVLGNPSDPVRSIPATVNATNEQLVIAGDDDNNCDTSDDRGADFYGILETDFNGVDPNNKREADWNFVFLQSNRGGAPVSFLGAIGGTGNSGMNENDAGVGWGGSRWRADSVWLSKPGVRTVRADLGNANAGIAPAYWLSFYATVSTATTQRGLQLPVGPAGVYGSWHCGANDAGIHNGWNCDGDQWYINPDGTLTPDPNGLLARPGATYQLRDVDCYDGRIGDTGVGVMPAFYGSEPCP